MLHIFEQNNYTSHSHIFDSETRLAPLEAATHRGQSTAL